MKKIILTFIVAALSLATSHAQTIELADLNTLLVLFASGTSQTLIDAKKIYYRVTHEEILPNTGVRIWTIQLPVPIGTDTLYTIIDVSNHANSNTQASIWKTSSNIATQSVAPAKGDTTPIKPDNIARGTGFNCPLNNRYPIIVGIADCGFSDVNNTGRFYNNPSHDDLFINKIWNNWDEFTDNRGIDDDGNGYANDYIGWNWTYRDPNMVSNRNVYMTTNGNNIPRDDHEYSHGTRINGIIASFLNPTRFNQVRLMNLKTQDSRGQGSMKSLIKAIDYAMGKDVKIMNLSLQYKGLKADENLSILKAVIELARLQNDMLFVVAAGNRVVDGVGDGRDLDDNSLYTIYPAYFKNSNIIVVAATTSTGEKAAFSNYGATSVDIAANGSSVYSATRYGFNNHPDSSSGTSFATAFVTATAALIGNNRPWSSSEVKRIILNTASQPAAPNATAWNNKSVTQKILNFHAALRCVPRGRGDVLSEFAKLNTGSIETAELLTAFPNPFSDMAQIKITTEKDVEATLTIQNAYGQVVLNQKMVLKGGENVFEWQANEAVKGIYIVKVQLDSQTLTQKIVKQ
jgi:hypothetical protein